MSLNVKYDTAGSYLLKIGRKTKNPSRIKARLVSLSEISFAVKNIKKDRRFRRNNG
jgi:hypothetical protein